MNPNTKLYQVSDLADEMRRLMEASYPEIWIEGELSSLSTPASGHLYFSLKDERSQLRCAMFKGRASINQYRPKVGDLVRVRAKISVYTARGDLQCIVQHIEEAGEGLLQRRFEELKQKLNAEGLFSQAHKQAVPSFAKHIGLITSPSGAAIRDIISTLGRRCPGLPVTVYPAVVQGDGGAASIVAAIRDAVQHQRCDVLILSRGGGSLEDLWCFNHEDVAREIFNCPIPVVSGVGHEVDVTIADLVADLRAPTPTAAAELLSPDTDQLIAKLKSLQFRLPSSFQRQIQRLAQMTDMTGRQLVHPKQQLKDKSDKLKQISKQISQTMLARLQTNKQALSDKQYRLRTHSPLSQVQRYQDLTRRLGQQLQQDQRRSTQRKRQLFESLGSQLHLVSPLATLDRGFAIARDRENQILRKTSQAKRGDTISVKISDGELECDVTGVSTT